MGHLQIGFCTWVFGIGSLLFSMIYVCDKVGDLWMSVSLELVFPDVGFFWNWFRNSFYNLQRWLDGFFFLGFLILGIS